MQRRPRLSILLHENAMLGAGLSIVRVLPSLEEMGWQLSVILPEEGPLLAELQDIEVSITRPSRPIGVSIKGWRRPPGVAQRTRDSRGYLAHLRRELKRQQPDVVHINTLHALPEGVVARCLGLPTVLHAHEIPPPSLKRNIAVRGATTVSDVVVAVSATVTAMYSSALPSARLTTVHNGVRLYSQIQPQDVPVVGSVGSICERKGTDVLLQAVQLVTAVRNDIVFEHVGPTIESNTREFGERLSKLASHANALKFLGPGSVDDALSRWGIFLLPSRQEAFPLATLEAMGAGLAVIASDVGGLSEQIIDGENGVLVPPDDPQALAHAILALVDNPLLRQQLGDAARRSVSEHFSYERQALGLHKAYLTAISRRGGF